MEFLIALAFVSGPLNGIITFLNIPFLNPLAISVFSLIPILYYRYFLQQRYRLIKISLLSTSVLLFFAGLVLLTSLYTKSTEVFVSKSLITLVLTLFAILISCSNDFCVKKWARSVVALSLPICVAFIYYFSQWRLGLLDADKYTLEIMSTIYLGAGGLAAISILILLFADLHMKLVSKYTLVVLFFVVLFISGARAPLFFMILCTCIASAKALIYRVSSGKAPKSIVFVPFLLVFFSAFIAKGISNIQGDVLDVVTKSVDRIWLLFSSDKGDSINTRFYYIDQASRFINDSLFLGHGIGSYGSVALYEEVFMYPHNMFLEAWFELGIIGLFIVSLIFILSIAFSYLSRSTVLFVVILFLWLNAMKSFSFAENRQLFILIGLVISIYTQSKIRQRSR